MNQLVRTWFFIRTFIKGLKTEVFNLESSVFSSTPYKTNGRDTIFCSKIGWRKNQKSKRKA
jgi:hypothetical protein